MPVIYPIGGGKGGVGKSFIAASLGVHMAMRGKRVVMVDLDLGAANLHTLLGIKTPKYGLNRFLNNGADHLADVAVPSHIAGLSLISSTQCSMEIANLSYAQKLKLIKAVRQLPFDVAILDLGAGTNFNTLDFFIAAQSGVVICTPEPTSIENTFRFIKAVHLRRLKQIIKEGPFNDEVKSAVAKNGKVGLKFGELMKKVKTCDSDQMSYLDGRLSEFGFNIVLNQHRKTTDPRLGLKLETVCNRHFAAPFRFAGRVDFDERIHDAVYQKKLFIELYPNAPAAVNLRNISRVLVRDNPLEAEKRSHYENIGS